MQRSPPGAAKPGAASAPRGSPAVRPAASVPARAVVSSVPAPRAGVAIAPARASAAPARPARPAAAASSAAASPPQSKTALGSRAAAGPAKPIARAGAAAASLRPGGKPTPSTAGVAKKAAPVAQALPAPAIPTPVPVVEEVPAPAPAPPPAPEPEPPAPPPPPVLDGNVVVRYNHYKPSLAITGGRLAATVVDEELYLSNVFKKCQLRLHADKAGGPELPFDGSGAISDTTFTGLTPGSTYWIGILEDAEEAAASEARSAAAYAAREAARAAKPAPLPGGDGIVRERLESCSCIEGNPCMDAYGCKDWNNRYEVAKAHGWRGP